VHAVGRSVWRCPSLFFSQGGVRTEWGWPSNGREGGGGGRRAFRTRRYATVHVVWTVLKIPCAGCYIVRQSCWHSYYYYWKISSKSKLLKQCWAHQDLSRWTFIRWCKSSLQLVSQNRTIRTTISNIHICLMLLQSEYLTCLSYEVCWKYFYLIFQHLCFFKSVDTNCIRGVMEHTYWRRFVCTLLRNNKLMFQFQ